MNEITSFIAAQLEDTFLAATIESISGPQTQPTPGVTPVFQLGEFPIPIDPELYKGAFGPTMPSSLGGNFIPLRRFYELVDRIPYFQKTYFPSSFSSDQLYGRLLALSTIDSDVPNSVRQLINDAKQIYSQAGYDDLTLSGARWRPHFPSMDNWWEFSDNDPTMILAGTDSPAPSGSVVIPGSENFKWRLENFSGSASLASGTIIKEVSFKYRFVMIQRPWFDQLLLQLGEYITILGFNEGAFSSGSFTQNQGLFPLMPIGFLLASDIVIKATWSERDKSLVDLLREGAVNGSLGPFAVGLTSTPLDRNTLSARLESDLANSLLEERSLEITHINNEINNSLSTNHFIPINDLNLEGNLSQNLGNFTTNRDFLIGSFYNGSNYDGPIIGPPPPNIDGVNIIFPRPRVIIRFPKSLPILPSLPPLPPPVDPEAITYKGVQIIGWLSVLLPKLPN